MTQVMCLTEVVEVTKVVQHSSDGRRNFSGMAP